MNDIANFPITTLIKQRQCPAFDHISEKYLKFTAMLKFIQLVGISNLYSY
jgi:hypothetical protein